jgi:hypothetical protein
VVTDWRETDFAPLALPNIILPGENETIVSTVAEETSWAKSLSQFFTPSKFGWQTAGVGFAGLLILGFLFLYSADLIKPPGNVAETVPAFTNTATPENNSPSQYIYAPEEKSVAQNKLSVKTSIKPEEKTNVASVRVTHKMPKQSEFRAVTNENLPKRSFLNRKAKQKVEDLSVLSAEAEDNTPRLTDLLEEIEPST